ncbi:hypothetical protein K503DRAFT_802180 [Rhizopogon vinicolor AM-OR11-026]|uniref:Uncharacterized protein n=1 Tax=Rhizopogon vinicolor AM-OR11-026 TaxID=1314800 RepID=A0A1B7MUF9_9AGAM|nr:hypothetical protein K503DRAFT_802180 [Rhizopogon vinicolor AM-OR11-026]
MEGVPLYYLEKSYGYPAEDFVPQLPEKTRSYLTKEHATTSHPTQHFGQSTYLTTSSTVQQATFSHHPFANPVSQQTATHPLSHHRAAQGSHTQNPCMHHATYLSSGIATRSATSMSMSMSSPGPMPVQHGMQYSYGTPHATSPHHSSLGSYAHVHSAPHTHLPQAQRNAQQQLHTQAGPSQHPSNVGSVQNNAALARQSAKDALIARCSCDVQ